MGKILLPEWMIHQSFRYCLGRMTYAVSVWIDWAVDNWDDIPENTQKLIKRELQEAFDLDKCVKSGILGMDMDKEQWKRLLNR